MFVKNLKMPIILYWDYLSLKLRLVLVFMQYYLLACFLLFHFFQILVLFIRTEECIIFKNHIMILMYFSLSLAFCLKMYPSEDVPLELPES